MKNLKRIIFQNNEVTFSCMKGERGIDYYANNIKLDRFDLLACALNADNEDEAWSILNLASRLYHPQDDKTFNKLYGSAAMNVTRRFAESELRIQSLFKENLRRLLGTECRLLKHKKNDCHHIPDAWVIQNNEEKPVEVKLGKFDEKALKQLERYMRVYRCDGGIAVGRTLDVTLPSNILFIPISQIEEAARNA